MRTLLVLLMVALAGARTAEEKETMLKSIRMKTSRQLKEIFDEVCSHCHTPANAPTLLLTRWTV